MRKFKKHLVTVLLSCIGSISIMSSSAFAAQDSIVMEQEPVETFADSAISSRAYEYEWKYKAINYVIHRRLWNATLGKWVGEWEAA